MATFAIHTTAARPALAFPIVLSCRSDLNHLLGVPGPGLNCHDFNAVGVSLLHALALVGTVAVAAGRHCRVMEGKSN
ncbi:hypothetical protein CEJ83_20115, partial [Acinetobacter baumannii]